MEEVSVILRSDFASSTTRRDTVFSSAQGSKARRRWVLLRISNDGSMDIMLTNWSNRQDLMIVLTHYKRERSTLPYRHLRRLQSRLLRHS
jgi:hypothetical protein